MLMKKLGLLITTLFFKDKIEKYVAVSKRKAPFALRSLRSHRPVVLNSILKIAKYEGYR